MNILYKFRFSFLLAFLSICLFFGANTAYGLDSLARERIRKHINKQIDKQIAQNALNDKLGKSHLNDYVMDINTLDPDETDEFKIKKANNGTSLYDLSGDAFNNPTNGIKKLLQNANVGLAGKPKIYLVLISIYDYNRDVVNWYKISESKKKNPNYASSPYNSVDNFSYDWKKVSANLETNKTAYSNYQKGLITAGTNSAMATMERKREDNIFGRFVGAIMQEKINVSFSNQSIASFSTYKISFESGTNIPKYAIRTNIMRFEAMPKLLLDLIDENTTADLQVDATRNQGLRKIIEILSTYSECQTDLTAEITRIKNTLESKLTANSSQRVITFDNAGHDYTPFIYSVSSLANLEDKLDILEEKTGYKMYVVIDNGKVHPCSMSNTIAYQVLQQYTGTILPKSDTKFGFIYIGLAEKRYINLGTPQAHYSITISNSFGATMGAELQALAQNLAMGYNGQIIKAGNQDGFSGLVEEYVRTLYRALPKPATVYTYTMNGKGDITEMPIQKTNSIKGLDIYNFVLVEDKRIKELITEHNRVILMRAILKRTTDPQTIANGEIEIEKSLTIIERIETTLPSDNELIVVDHQLREPLLEVMASEVIAGIGTIKYNALARQFVRWRLKEYVGDGLEDVFPVGFLQDAPPNTAFETGKNEPKIAKAKEKIDDLGLALAPIGLDFLADAYGAVYCFSNNDAAGGLLYTACAIIPLADKTIVLVKNANNVAYDFLRKANYAYDIRLVTQGRTLSTLIPVGEIVIRTLFKNVPFAQLDVNFLLKVKELGFSQRQIKALDADFLNNIALFNAMKADYTLLQAWKEVKYLTTYRKEKTFLEAIKKVKDDDVWKHIAGELGFNPIYSSGGHYLGATEIIEEAGVRWIISSKIKFKVADIRKPEGLATSLLESGTLADANILLNSSTIEKARRIHIYIGTNWTPKANGGTSDFFLKTWDKEKIMEETALAFKKAKQTPTNYWVTGNTYDVLSSDGGTKIRFYYGVDQSISNPLLSPLNNSIISSSFPIR